MTNTRLDPVLAFLKRYYTPERCKVLRAERRKRLKRAGKGKRGDGGVLMTHKQRGF